MLVMLTQYACPSWVGSVRTIHRCFVGLPGVGMRNVSPGRKDSVAPIIQRLTICGHDQLLEGLEEWLLFVGESSVHV